MRQNSSFSCPQEKGGASQSRATVWQEDDRLRCSFMSHKIICAEYGFGDTERGGREGGGMLCVIPGQIAAFSAVVRTTLSDRALSTLIHSFISKWRVSPVLNLRAGFPLGCIFRVCSYKHVPRGWRSGWSVSSFPSRPICVYLQQNLVSLQLCMSVQACVSFGLCRGSSWGGWYKKGWESQKESQALVKSTQLQRRIMVGDGTERTRAKSRGCPHRQKSCVCNASNKSIIALCR